MFVRSRIKILLRDEPATNDERRTPHAEPERRTSHGAPRTTNGMITLDGSSLTIEQLVAVADRGERVSLASDARDRVRASRAVVDRRAQGPEPAYGINTGFGSFADVRIPPDALEALQLN